MNVDGEIGAGLAAPNPAPLPVGEAPGLVQGAERDKEQESGTMECPGTAGFWLSPQQKHVWTLQQEGRAFGTTCLVLVDGALSVENLRRALHQLVGRHEILRTVYRRQAGMKFPFQVVLDGADPAVELVDLSGLSDSEQTEQLETRCRKEQALSLGPT